MNLTKNKRKPVTTLIPGEVVEEKYNGSNAKFVVFKTKAYKGTDTYKRTVSFDHLKNFDFKYISWGDGHISLPGDESLSNTYEAKKLFGALSYILPSYYIVVYGIDNFGVAATDQSNHMITVKTESENNLMFDFIESIYFGEGVNIWENTKDSPSGAYYINGKTTYIPALSSISNLSTCPVSAFRYQTSLDKVSFSGDCKEIKDAAFEECTNLIEIVIPVTIQAISNTAFGSKTLDSYKLSIFYEGSEEEWGNIKYSKDTDIISTVDIYCYSKNKPTTAGNYWHYVNGEPTVWEIEEE